MEVLLRRLAGQPYGGAAKAFPLYQYHSRYVSPILWVAERDKHMVIQQCQQWIHRIVNRLGQPLHNHLIVTVPEIISNLVKHGFAGGAFVISIWPNGQVELLWCNRVDHLPDWPQTDSASDLAEALSARREGGSGMAYIFDVLLPTYSGILSVNHRGNDVVFRAGRYIDVFGHGRRSDVFLPRSVLFALELFAPEVHESAERSFR
jgi:hypothetical protein